ncbi:methyltransferase domain-containing protein [Pseudomonas sp. 22-AL-CL-001]|uniref:methyltransferase domain-containing protein n=1 Tax=Pseudomonas alabamensis TaxID=3064349 RepID=UPI002712ADDC|nr:methyltransferase domain-containing protein [Pseudomonas sp. 22-AL-CL-001]MDO7910163.1 methyltransferase domain-containing protein [Pseudomonas sp. 22-AL-CL-001]
MMDDGFYRGFEDRYRGSRELISQRLEAYLPFLAPLKKLYTDYPVLDLGCGRGEWLELLTREGYAPTGVDLDEGMLEACRALGLPARNIDALSALRELPDASLVAVTGFHIAEHVPFPVLQELVAEALRVLRPAGLLILETPNAESLVVGTNSFYLDPTHERPLPSLLLSFLAEYSGFERAKIVRLQEPAELHDQSRRLGVLDVLTGTSPDYAVVAQKRAEPASLSGFDETFDAAYGMALDQLAARYDHAMEHRLAGLENEVATARTQLMTREQFSEALDSIHRQQTEQLRMIQERHALDMEALRQQADLMQQQNVELATQAASLAEQAASLSAQTASLQADLDQSLNNAHTWYLRANQHEQYAQALHKSTSWRITGPLRVLGRVARTPKQTARSVIGRSLPHARLWLARRPVLDRKVMALLSRCPRLTEKLYNLYRSNQVLQPVPVASGDVAPMSPTIDQAPLTVRGRAIEQALQAAIKKSQN